MKRITLSQVAGVLTLSLGMIVIFGWYTHNFRLVTFVPDSSVIVFNSALVFLLAGIALLVPNYFPSVQKNLHLTIGSLVALIALLTLSQNIFSYSLGLDELFITQGVFDQSDHPGRMADNSALAFLFSGLAFILFPFIYNKTAEIFAQIFIFSTLILGFSALAGYFLNMAALYRWSPDAYMSLQSAIGNTVLALGLWSYWNKKVTPLELSPEKEEQRILSICAIVLFCVLLLVGSILVRLSFHAGNASYQMVHVEVQTAILIAVIVGMSVLLWQLIPLIKQILRSEKKLLEANILIKESENRFRSAFDHASVGMALISLQGKFLRVNQSLCQILGYSEKELLTIDPNQIIHLDDFKNNKIYIDDMIDGKVKIYQTMQRYYHKNGDIVWVALNMSLVSTSQDDKPLYFIAQFLNVTSEKKAEEQLRHLAYHDALTNLLNRNSLEERMQEILTAAQRHGNGFSIIFLDLDRFKNINDTIGHDAGDMLLQIVGKRLKNSVHSTDAVSRIGGDEFVIVLNELNKVEVITNIVQKIIEKLHQPIITKGHELFINTSIGISVYPYDGNDVQTLMKNADLALYRAKELGRNNYQFCTQEMTSKAQQKMKRQNAVVQAMAKNEFQLYFQPKLELASQTISGVEALLRWQNTEYSNVPITEIIHLAEEAGLIIALNEWVLKTACEQMVVWHNAGFHRLTLAVNLSARQFKQANFIDSLIRVLANTGFPAECLELEITETLIMQDPEYILNMLHLLKDKGICIAIDNFGTGYSSLDYLRRFSIDKIKIDKKFIHSMSSDSASMSVVSAMILMASKLGIDTVAEGVETREQYDFLLHEKCSEIQGYYLSPPVDADALIKFLQNPIMESFMMRTADGDEKE